MTDYDFGCEYCEGIVRERIVPQEAICHHRGIAVLENVPIGVCDHCGAHYYAATVLKRVEAMLSSQKPPERTLKVPVETF